jgi:peptidoglycan-associated lipoprotein
MRRTPCRCIALAMALLALMLSANGCKPKPPKDLNPLNNRGTTVPKPPTTQSEALAPKISLIASPTAIEMGKSTTLSWESSNATSVTIDNGIGTVEASGGRTISPRASTTYKATATGQIGNPATAEVRVTVTPPITITGDQGGDKPPDKLYEQVQREITDSFFDYDQYSIRDDARTALLANARLLKKYPEVKITIEGFCDERGSEKYNLALGDRRAIAAKDFLTAQGIESSRIDTLSYGKEKSFCEEHNEDCWQLNRRAHFMLR